MSATPTYHADKALSDSSEIIRTVSKNLTRYLAAKKRTRSHFFDWARDQHLTGVRPVRMMKWRGLRTDPDKDGTVDTDNLSAICLVAAYMNKPVKDVMFTEIPIDRL
jgi:hypothetical protein